MELTRRAALRAGIVAGGVGVAGCAAPTTDPFVSEGFEDGMGPWETAASIGAGGEGDPPLSAFDWAVERSRERAFAGEWSLRVFTGGEHDDGTAWAVREVSPPANADLFEASCRAWSPSESFNTLRHLVFVLAPERPESEADFPDPGADSSAVADVAYGGLRQPLHLEAGWREYSFVWEPGTVPDTLYLAVGVSAVWEADATHYVDAVTVRAD